jgi:hypothetical protein
MGTESTLTGGFRRALIWLGGAAEKEAQPLLYDANRERNAAIQRVRDGR